MAGYRVVFYVMVGDSSRLPDLRLGPLRTVRVLTIAEDGWWQDHDHLRMANLGEHIVGHIQAEVDFLFLMTVDQVFRSHVGVETLGTSVAQLHAWWFFRETQNLPYERRTRSTACIPFGQGDFFYDGALVGGTPLQLLNLITEYLEGVTQDMQNGLSSTYERHLNKYFFLHKPTKLLSPEYCWDAALFPPPQVQYVKVLRPARRGLRPAKRGL